MIEPMLRSSPRPSVRVPRVLVATLALALLLPAGCATTGQGEAVSASAPSQASPEPAKHTATAPVPEPSVQSAAPSTSEPTPDPGEALRERADQIVAGLSVHEKAGLVVVASHRGPEPPVDLVLGQHLGGIIIMDGDLTTEQVRTINTTLAQAAADAGRDWPLLLAVDQEGGLVERAKDELTRWPTFMSFGAADDVELTRRAAAASGAELAGAGFTVDFAPEADVTIGPTDPTIGSRSAGSDPELVARHAVAAATGFLEAGVLPVVKHFPGHGSVPADSHETLPVQQRSLDELRRTDLVPFAAAVEAGLPAVMVGHLDVAALGTGLPSSLDPAVVDGMLRDDLGFDGLVVTDALEMAAVANTYGTGEAAVRALEAGVDVVLMPPDPVVARAAIEQAVDQGRLPQARLDEALRRQIVALLSLEQGRTLDAAEPGSQRPTSREVSAAAITVTAGACTGPLVEGGIIPVGERLAVQRLVKAAERAGLAVGQGTVVELVGFGGRPGGGAGVTVTTDSPYPLARSSAPVRIALYGDTPGAMAALVDVLTGAASAPGRLPVAVDGQERQGC